MRHASAASATWQVLVDPFLYTDECLHKALGPCDSKNCLADSPRQNGMKAALLARSHLCCLSVLGKTRGMDSGASPARAAVEAAATPAANWYGSSGLFET